PGSASLPPDAALNLLKNDDRRSQRQPDLLHHLCFLSCFSQQALLMNEFVIRLPGFGLIAEGMGPRKSGCAGSTPSPLSAELKQVTVAAWLTYAPLELFSPLDVCDRWRTSKHHQRNRARLRFESHANATPSR